MRSLHIVKLVVSFIIAYCGIISFMIVYTNPPENFQDFYDEVIYGIFRDDYMLWVAGVMWIGVFIGIFALGDSDVYSNDLWPKEEK